MLFRIMPGDPTVPVIGEINNPESRQALIELFGLDKPLHIQFILYIRNILTGNFGISFRSQEPVLDRIVDRLPNTLVLMGTGIVLIFSIAIVVGAFLAVNRGKKLPRIITTIIFMCRSMPHFWVGMILLTIFAYELNWLPIGKMMTPGYEQVGFFEKVFSLDFLRHLVLPMLTILIYYLGDPALVMKNSMLNVFGEDFVELARAKGIGERRVTFRHVVRNALLPMISLISLMLGFAIGGVAVIETVFSWPGMGKDLVDAVWDHDYPVAQAVFLLMGVIVIFGNLITDILYAYLDPRISYR
jgi:peptide/nickel transport system permease protein